MIQSMTGFGSSESENAGVGKISVELRSTNHKFLEIVFHSPDGFMSLEDRIKKEIETKIKRGRVSCSINISGARSTKVCINKPLLANYVSALKQIRVEHKTKDEISLDLLLRLPGVLSLEDRGISKEALWPLLKSQIKTALGGLEKTRKKEGAALEVFLRNRAEGVHKDLEFIKERYKKAVKEALEELNTDEAKASFLKDSDINEEIERLTFHIRNFKHKLTKSGPVGKELDFIAQEMQRETNTMGAKSFDVGVSARVVQIKSQIEKIREQVQNIE
jgi:uncharacterized protein (TIGR00255 family)